MSLQDVMADDLKNILKGEFSEEITITSGTDSVTVKGFFDKGFLEVSPDSAIPVPVLSDKTRVLVIESEVTMTITENSTTVTARGKTRTVKYKRRNGDGSLGLYLAK